MENNSENKSNNQPPAPKSRAQSPVSIGLAIEQVMEKKHMTPVELAAKLRINKRSIYRLLKSRTMSVSRLMKMSEVLDENFLLLYQPSVTIVPNALEEENRQLKEQIVQLNARLEEMKNLQEENIRLKVKADLLQELFNKR